MVCVSVRFEEVSGRCRESETDQIPPIDNLDTWKKAPTTHVRSESRQIIGSALCFLENTATNGKFVVYNFTESLNDKTNVIVNCLKDIQMGQEKPSFLFTYKKIDVHMFNIFTCDLLGLYILVYFFGVFTL